MTTSIRHLTSIKDLTDAEFKTLVERAAFFKKVFKNKNTEEFQEYHNQLLGQTVALLFSKRSTRTRISTEGAAAFFGGQPMFLGKDDIQLGVNESFYDSIKVISSMVSCIFARVNSNYDIQQLCKYSSVPIINSLCDTYHPLQAICDMLTITEKFPTLKNSKTNKNLKMAWVGDSNNVINDMAIAALKLGIDVAISTPSDIEMSKDIIDAGNDVIKRNPNGKMTLDVTHNSVSAVKNADIVVTDTFISMGEEAEQEKKLKQFEGFQVTSELCKNANDDFVFMHCLPRHHHEVDDETFYSKNSIVFDEAENRLYAAMAVIDIFVVKKGNFNA